MVSKSPGRKKVLTDELLNKIAQVRQTPDRPNGLTPVGIAKHFGIPIGTAKQAVWKIRRREGKHCLNLEASANISEKLVYHLIEIYEASGEFFQPESGTAQAYPYDDPELIFFKSSKKQR